MFLGKSINKKFSWGSVQFLGIWWAMLKINKMEKKYSYAIAALDDLLAGTIYGQPQDSKSRDHNIWYSKFINYSSKAHLGKS